MPAPKAPRNHKNQPTTFEETVMPALTIPAAPVGLTLPALPRLTNRQLRNSLIVIWVLAVVTAGAGLGLILRGHATTPSPAGVPVATANLVVTPTAASAITNLVVNHQPNLSVTTSTSVNQAQAGQPFAATSTDTYQPAADLSTLQPGYTPAGSPQGTRGTDPVE